MNSDTFPQALEAHVQTKMSRRYLAQLCKHFGHRLPTTYEGVRGRIEFAAGICELSATETPTMLDLRVTAADEIAVAALADVVARHLTRFAFREAPEVVWQRAA